MCTVNLRIISNKPEIQLQLWFAFENSRDGEVDTTVYWTWNLETWNLTKSLANWKNGWAWIRPGRFYGTHRSKSISSENQPMHLGRFRWISFVNRILYSLCSSSIGVIVLVEVKSAHSQSNKAQKWNLALWYQKVETRKKTENERYLGMDTTRTILREEWIDLDIVRKSADWPWLEILLN